MFRSFLLPIIIANNNSPHTYIRFYDCIPLPDDGLQKGPKHVARLNLQEKSSYVWWLKYALFPELFTSLQGVRHPRRLTAPLWAPRFSKINFQSTSRQQFQTVTSHNACSYIANLWVQVSLYSWQSLAWPRNSFHAPPSLHILTPYWFAYIPPKWCRESAAI
jgi:hypothetical protein